MQGVVWAGVVWAGEQARLRPLSEGAPWPLRPPQVQVMLMSLLSLATSLEDPFDEAAVDAVSFAEARDHILFVGAPHGRACLPCLLCLIGGGQGPHPVCGCPTRQGAACPRSCRGCRWRLRMRLCSAPARTPRPGEICRTEVMTSHSSWSAHGCVHTGFMCSPARAQGQFGTSCWSDCRPAPPSPGSRPPPAPALPRCRSSWISKRRARLMRRRTWTWARVGGAAAGGGCGARAAGQLGGVVGPHAPHAQSY